MMMEQNEKKENLEIQNNQINNVDNNQVSSSNSLTSETENIKSNSPSNLNGEPDFSSLIKNFNFENLAISRDQKDKINPLEKVVISLARRLFELEKRTSNIEKDKVVENLQLPKEVIEATGIIPEPKFIRRGPGNRPILLSEIEEAYKKHNNCAAAAARELGVSYITFKKHAVRAGVWKTNPNIRKKDKKFWDPNKGRYPLSKILEGQFPNYPVYRLKDLLIRSKTKPARCEMCGWEHRRLTDGKIPLLVNFKDGNNKNHKLENIQILCYNCTFCYGRGYIKKRKVQYDFSDPDRMQDALKPIPARF